MPRVDTQQFDLSRIEDPTDLNPRPTLSMSDDGYSMAHLGNEGKLLLKQLLDATNAEADAEARVFGTLGVDAYDHVAWEGHDLFWADEDALVDALRQWHSAQNLG